MDSEDERTLTERVDSLQKQLAEAEQNHEKEITELVDEAEDLRYWVSRTRSNLTDETRKVTELRLQLADIRRMIANIQERLESRETHIGEGSLQEQLIDALGFIGTKSTSSHFHIPSHFHVQYCRAIAFKWRYHPHWQAKEREHVALKSILLNAETMFDLNQIRVSNEELHDVVLKLGRMNLDAKSMLQLNKHKLSKG
ncbi:hypothetical protein C8R46DRAFT_1227481 [Mycena filopes]|nr:hypothetical protein C8R46DRAFT_1227481 [Mycena filopes]